MNIPDYLIYFFRTDRMLLCYLDDATAEEMLASDVL